MSGEIIIPIYGNLTRDPEQATVGNTPAVRLTIAASKRYFNRNTGNYDDGGTVYLDATAFGAEVVDNILKSLRKGMRVVAVGELQQYSSTDQQGNKHSHISMRITEIGPSLMRASADVHPNPRRGNGFGNGFQQSRNGFAQNGGYGQGSGGYPQQNGFAAPASAPWSQSGGGYAGNPDEPDF